MLKTYLNRFASDEFRHRHRIRPDRLADRRRHHRRRDDAGHEAHGHLRFRQRQPEVTQWRAFSRPGRAPFLQHGRKII